jgi:hypothetical protein
LTTAFRDRTFAFGAFALRAFAFWAFGAAFRGLAFRALAFGFWAFRGLATALDRAFGLGRALALVRLTLAALRTLDFNLCLVPFFALAAINATRKRTVG